MLSIISSVEYFLTVPFNVMWEKWLSLGYEILGRDYWENTIIVLLVILLKNKTNCTNLFVNEAVSSYFNLKDNLIQR